MRQWRYLFLLAGVAGGAAGGATAASAYSAQLPDPMEFGVVYEKLAFEAADTNGNDLVSEGEFVRDAAAGFAGLDFNRDRRLTPQELGPHDPKQFARVDADGDGTLTFSEVMSYKMKAFVAADSNRDGSLSFDEMVRSASAEAARE